MTVGERSLNSRSQIQLSNNENPGESQPFAYNEFMSPRRDSKLGGTLTMIEAGSYNSYHKPIA